jgi:hypothetical protein
MKIWLATDENNLLSQGPTTCLFYGAKPKLIDGYWKQKRLGRWPIPNPIKQKRGAIVEVVIKPRART